MSVHVERATSPRLTRREMEALRLALERDGFAMTGDNPHSVVGRLVAMGHMAVDRGYWRVTAKGRRAVAAKTLDFDAVRQLRPGEVVAVSFPQFGRAPRRKWMSKPVEYRVVSAQAPWETHGKNATRVELEPVNARLPKATMLIRPGFETPALDQMLMLYGRDGLGHTTGHPFTLEAVTTTATSRKATKKATTTSRKATTKATRSSKKATTRKATTTSRKATTKATTTTSRKATTKATTTTSRKATASKRTRKATTSRKRPAELRPSRPTRRRKTGGARVNPTVPLPQPPGPWVDETQNYVTRKRYDQFRSKGCDFASAHQRIRSAAAAQGVPGGGYRTRGPVLHAMRVCKLEQWYENAMADGQLWNEAEGRPYTRRELERIERELERIEPYDSSGDTWDESIPF